MKSNIKRPYFEKIFEISDDTIVDEMIEFVEGCKRDPKDIWKRPMYANKTNVSKSNKSQESGSTIDIRKIYDSV